VLPFRRIGDQLRQTTRRGAAMGRPRRDQDHARKMTIALVVVAVVLALALVRKLAGCYP